MAWRPQYVDLRRVIALQKLIVTDGLDARVAAASENKEALVELCLPTAGPEVELDVTPDVTGRAIMISSPNPNLRSQGLNLSVPPGNVVAGAFGLGSPHMTVVRLGDRYVLRDGTHRAAGLLARGTFTVPLVVIEGTGPSDIAMNPDLFPPQVALGEHPPLVVDFLDDTIAAAATRKPLRKALRYIVEEFYIPR